MDEKLKVGIDIHGVMDKYTFFKSMARAMIDAGHEIHIITGASTEKGIADLKSLGIVSGEDYTVLFSVTDHLISEGVRVTWKNPNDPIFPDDLWDEAKSVYCLKHNIDMHFDDSDTYGKHFKTPYAKVLTKNPAD